MCLAQENPRFLWVSREKKRKELVVVFTYRYNIPHMAFCQGISSIHFLLANAVPMHLHRCQSAPYKLTIGLTMKSALSQMIAKPRVIYYSSEQDKYISRVSFPLLLV